MSDFVPVSRDAAAAALRARVWELTPTIGEPLLIHSFAHTTGLALGADADLALVLEDVEAADEIAWVRHPLRHDLVVRVGDRVRYYDVPRPEELG